jgi:hypothetical protein
MRKNMKSFRQHPVVPSENNKYRIALALDNV